MAKSSFPLAKTSHPKIDLSGLDPKLRAPSPRIPAFPGDLPSGHKTREHTLRSRDPTDQGDRF